MAVVRRAGKSCRVDSLKMSPALGAALAFLGVRGGVPLLLGSRGCATGGLALLSRHFQKPIRIESLAADEIDVVLGGSGRLAAALESIRRRSRGNPPLVGLISSGMNEMRGEDVEVLRPAGRPQPSPPGRSMVLVPVAVPDFAGSFPDGWAAATQSMIETLARPAPRRRQINILPGCFLSPGDVETLRDIAERFGLKAVILPDLSGPLGACLAGRGNGCAEAAAAPPDVRSMGAALGTIAVGEQMRPAAQALKDAAGVPFALFRSLTGLQAVDGFLAHLADLSGRAVPACFHRRRRMLLEAMAAAQDVLAGKKAAVALGPDDLAALCVWFTEMGMDIEAAVATEDAPILRDVPTREVIVGDLEDLEAAARNADLLAAPSLAGRLAHGLGIPLLRMGLPITDRFGAARSVCVGYAGTARLLASVADLLLQRT